MSAFVAFELGEARKGVIARILLLVAEIDSRLAWIRIEPERQELGRERADIDAAKALRLMADQHQWADAPVLAALRAAVPAAAWESASEADVLTPGGPAYLPAAYAKALADAVA